MLPKIFGTGNKCGEALIMHPKVKGNHPCRSQRLRPEYLVAGHLKLVRKYITCFRVPHRLALGPAWRSRSSNRAHFFHSHNSTNMAAIEALEAALDELKLREKPEYTAVAKKYGVDRNTLSRRHRGVQGTRKAKYQNQQSLNTAQESQLLKYIQKLSARGLPPTREMVRNFASEIAKKPVGKSWVSRFLGRNHEKVFSAFSSPLDRARFRADSTTKYELYFKLLSDKIAQYGVEAKHTYNMDEKGFLIGMLGKQKRIFPRASSRSQASIASIQDGNREWITLLACICADGSALTPALIYQAVSSQIQDTWLQDFDAKKHKIHLTSSPSGWTNNDVGLAWLRDVFDQETKQKATAERARRLLILDGHGSHLTMAFIDYCDRNRILLAILPPHSTHTLQPLDVGLFSPLAGAYRAALQRFLHQSQGLTALTKRDFFRLFWEAWNKCFIARTIKKAFETTGIAPLDSERIVSKFRTKYDSRPTSSCSNTSVSIYSKPAAIRRLIREFKADPDAQIAGILTDTIIGLAAQNALLHHENLGLREAFLNEQKRRKRGKALVFEQPSDYHGGAQFYSPTKVESARLKQQQKELDEAAAQQQKDEAIRLRSEQKLLKQQQLQMRKELRLQAQEARIALKAEKQQVKEAALEQKQLEKQLKIDIQLSQKGKKQSAKLQSLPQAKTAATTSYTAAVEPIQALETSTRSGRVVKRPSKFN